MDDASLVRALKALAHPKRFRMVQQIAAAGELSCTQLGERFALSQPTVSHHLKLLSEAGVLAVRQQAQHHYISVDRRLLRQILASLPARLAAPARRRKSTRPRPAKRS